MQVLLVTDDPRMEEDVLLSFVEAGVLIMATRSLTVAEAFVRRNPLDLLILEERVSDRLTHSLALLAEHQNQHLSTIVVTEKTGEDADELFELIPSIHCLLGRDVTAPLMLQLGRASVTGAVDAVFSRSGIGRAGVAVLPPMRPLAA